MSRFSEDTILSKDVEIEKLKLKLLKHLKEKKQWPGYMEYSGSVKAEKLSQETNSKLEQEETRHLQETQRLKQILQEKDRKLEALRVKIEMARKETQEKNEEYLKAMQDHQKNLLEEAIKKFDTAAEEAHREFVDARETLELEAREGKISGERRLNDACANFKQKLHEYYKEVTRQDLDTIKKLKQDIKRVEENIEKSKLRLKQAREENNFQKTIPKPRFPRPHYSQIFANHDANEVKMTEAFRTHNRLEKLTLKNQELERQIKAVTEETLNLRKQFTLALKRVRDSAEMKATVLERKLNAIMDRNGSESSASDEISYSPEESDVHGTPSYVIDHNP